MCLDVDTRRDICSEKNKINDYDNGINNKTDSSVGISHGCRINSIIKITLVLINKIDTINYFSARQSRLR